MVKTRVIRQRVIEGPNARDQSAFCAFHVYSCSGSPNECWLHKAVLAKERGRQLTTAHANQTTGVTNGRAANWAPEVVFSPFRALFRRQLTFPICC